MRSEIELLLKNPRALGAQPHRVSNNRLDVNLMKKSAVLTFTKIVLFSLYANAGRGNSVGFIETPASFMDTPRTCSQDMSRPGILIVYIDSKSSRSFL